MKAYHCVYSTKARGNICSNTGWIKEAALYPLVYRSLVHLIEFSDGRGTRKRLSDMNPNVRMKLSEPEALTVKSEDVRMGMFRREKKELYEAYADGKLTVEAYKAAIAEVDERIKAMKPEENAKADSGENECQEERKEREYPAAYRLLRTDLLTNRMCKSFLDRGGNSFRVSLKESERSASFGRRFLGFKVEVRFKFGKVKWL